MDQPAIAPPTYRPAVRPGRPVVFAAVAGIIVIAALIALSLSGVLRPQASAVVPVPVSPAVEATWGIRVTQVAATADGGLVDFRFIVLNADKAHEVMYTLADLPVLHPEGSSLVVNSTPQMTSHQDMRVGEQYFLIYRNTQGVIKPGTPVTIVFSDGLKIEHVIAR
ncbi:MAG: hypothetical protein ACHQNA_09655 [Acidimicrobiales bacterium]